MSIAKETATIATVTAFVNDKLVADDGPVDARTPLLELGLLDSLGLGSLLAFIQDRFGVIVPDERVVPSCFMDIEHVASLIDELCQAGDGIGPVPPAPADSGAVGTRTLSLPSGAEIHALEVTGRGPQWLLLPGLGEVASSWSAMLQGLAGEHRALAIDYAGFGLSTCSQPEPTLSDHVAHALELLHELAPQSASATEATSTEGGPQSPVVLVGCSAGSIVACELARRLGSRVQALIVTGFGLITDPDAWWSAMQRLADDPRAFLAAAFDRPVTLSTSALEEVLSRPAYRSFLGPEDRARLPSMFEGINVPVLVVGGQSDGIIPRDAFVRAGEATGTARLEWLARCGHFPHVECTDELVHLIERFLEEHAP